MCSADFGSRVRSRGTSIACPVEYSRCTRSMRSSVIGMVWSVSTSDSRSRSAMAGSGRGRTANSRGFRMRAMRTALLVAAAAFAALGAAAEDIKPARLALVIGNAQYRDAPLPNAANDAADMAKALQASGFTVIRRDNATLREMHLALREFGDKLGRQATGLVYFAGHGMQVRGRNYLVPVDADIAREDEAAFAALDLGAVMDKLDSAKNP